MDDISKINAWLKENQLSLSSEQIESFIKYIDLIKEASSRMNLISKNDLPIIVERHLLDSLCALKEYDFPIGAKVADLGSGAGFPGIPVAIARPDLQVDLIESRHRKSLFLKKVKTDLNLKNVQVIHNRWEKVNTLYDIVLVRAVYNSNDIREKVVPLLPPNGTVLHFAKFNNINILKNN